MKKAKYAPWLLVPGTIAAAFLLIPLVTIVIKTPWTNFFDLIATDVSIDALVLSAKTCAITLLISLVVGVPLAFVLAHLPDTWWARLIRTVVTLPMMLPPVVAGLALLLTWGRRGLIGEHLSVLGIEIGFSTIAVVMAQTFVAMPFLISSLEGAIRSSGIEYDETARSLGASRSRTFFEVTVPVMLPAIINAGCMCISRALGEFGATITFAGSLQGSTQTMPLAIYLQRQSSQDEALALAVVLIIAAIVVLYGGNLVASLLPGAKTKSQLKAKNKAKNRKAELIEQPDTTPIQITKPTSARPSACTSIHVDAAVADRGVHLTTNIPGGVLTSVMGPNGSGKSTLLGLISQTLEPTYGSVQFDPSNPQIVLLQQKPLLFPHMSVQSNVEFGLRARGLPRETVKTRAKAELASVGLTAMANRRPSQLSGGQAQRVAIARAMAIDPDIVLLDEPMAGLDERSADAMREDLAARLEASPFTAVLVTHDVEDADRLASNKILIRHGRVAKEETQ